MRPTIFKLTLKSGKIVKFCDYRINTLGDALTELKKMFRFTPTVVCVYKN